MSDTNFRPAASTGYGAGSGSAADELSPQHPRGSGMSYEARREHERASEQGYMDQASDIADEAWRRGRDYYEQGSRRVSEWAGEHPSQLWAAIAVAGAFALWMAYRPVFSPRQRTHFDASRYRYRRLPRPSGRAAFMERDAERAGRGL